MLDLNFSVVIKFVPTLLEGLWSTAWISFTSILIGFFLGLILYALSRSRFSLFNAIVKVYISLFRGTPLLVQLLIFVNVLPNDTPPQIVAILSLSMNTAAFQAEILRGGFNILPKGQSESCWVLGLNTLQAFFFIKLPQVIAVTIPALVNESIDIIKSSSLIYLVGVMDLMRYIESGSDNTARPLEFYIFAGLLYLILTSIVSYFGIFIEKKLNTHEEH